MIGKNDREYNGKILTKCEKDQREWAKHAEALRDWFLKHWFVRTDAFGGYKEDGSPQCVKWNALLPELLKHCKGWITIGTYTNGLDGTGKHLSIDIDCHDKGVSDPVANEKYAKLLWLAFRQMGFDPILTDSNGNGGFHIDVLFSEKIPLALLRNLGLWATGGHIGQGVTSPPEVFPKQFDASKPYGNFIRLPGRHHKREHFSRVWDGESWLSGSAAIRHMMATVPSPASTIPAKIKDFQIPVKDRKKDYKPSDWKGEYKTDQWWLNYGGDLKTLDIVKLFDDRGMLLGSGYPQEVICPWADGHSTGEGGAYLWKEEGAFPGYHCHHASCANAGRGLEDVLAHFGKDVVDSYCEKMFGDTMTSDEFEAKFQELHGQVEEPLIPVDTSPLAEYKSDARTSYLWKGIHGDHIDDAARRSRIESIEEVWKYIPSTGFFPSYIKHWLPTSDASVMFHLGCALSLSGVFCHRKVYIKAGGTTVKPIFWTGLLAGSSIMRKSSAIGCAKETMRMAGVDCLLPDSFSMHALYDILGFTRKTDAEIAEAMKEFESERILEADYLKGVGLFAVDEIGSFLQSLGKEYNSGGLGILTSWYDSPPDWKYSIKGNGKTGGGKVCIPNPHINICGASTLEWLSRSTNENDLGGGFYPRWLFFTSRTRDYLLPFRDDPSVSDLGDQTRRIRHAQGEMKLSPEAMSYYCEWRKQFEVGVGEDMGGWVNRMGDYCLKVALVYHASCKDGNDIGVEMVEVASRLIDRLKLDTAHLLEFDLAFGEADARTKAVKNFIQNKKSVSHRDLAKRFHRYDKKVLEGILDTLKGQELIGQSEGQKHGKMYLWQG